MVVQFDHSVYPTIHSIVAAARAISPIAQQDDARVTSLRRHRAERNHAPAHQHPYRYPNEPQCGADEECGAPGQNCFTSRGADIPPMLRPTCVIAAPSARFFGSDRWRSAFPPQGRLPIPPLPGTFWRRPTGGSCALIRSQIPPATRKPRRNDFRFRPAGPETSRQRARPAYSKEKAQSSQPKSF